jgi:hypothetical protein
MRPLHIGRRCKDALFNRTVLSSSDILAIDVCVPSVDTGGSR